MEFDTPTAKGLSFSTVKKASTSGGIHTNAQHWSKTWRDTGGKQPRYGIKQPDGSIKALSPKQVADILGHTTSQITEMYYVRKDTSRLNGITDGFEI